jgi:hypothetical protein
VVGGKESNQCEKYDLKTQLWSNLPNFQAKERMNPVLFLQKETSYLYCFFGMNSDNNFVETLERIKVDAPKAKWSVIPFKKNTNIDIFRISCGVVDKDDKIIFVGGVGKAGPNKNIIYFEFGTVTFGGMETSTNEENCIFSDSKLVRLNDNSYGNFNKDMNFLRFRFDD